MAGIRSFRMGATEIRMWLDVDFGASLWGSSDFHGGWAKEDKYET